MNNPVYDQLFVPHIGNQAPFLHLPDVGTVTYDAFVRRAGQFAQALVDLGAVAGDRIAVQVDKSSDVLALYAGCVQAGLVFLPLNPAYTAAEITYFVGNSAAKILVCRPQDAAALTPIAEQANATCITMGDDQSGALCELAAKTAPLMGSVSRGPDDLAAILYTSGTTGRSKGAMLSHKNLLSNARALTDLWQFTSADRLINALPVFHTHGLFVATNITLLAGGSMDFMPKFDLDAISAAMPSATTMMGVPTFYTRLLDDRRLTRDSTSNMRLFISGSAPLLAEIHRAFTGRTGHMILERYGMTETNMSTSNPYAGDRRAGTVGLPLPGVEAKVCDANGAELPRGEVGTLEVRGDNVFLGYWQMPDKTAAELRADGFFITGDLATMDADGYVTIVGRGKDLIISGGLNIYPKEIEEVIDAQTGILESTVIGVPHPDLGEAALAVVVVDGKGAVSEQGVLSDLAEKLAKFKHPRQVVVVDALPRNTMGKVQKAALREAYRDSFTL